MVERTLTVSEQNGKYLRERRNTERTQAAEEEELQKELEELTGQYKWLKRSKKIQ